MSGVAVRFTLADGRGTLATASAGDRLLDVAQAAGLPLEGTCGGQMACGTCHVVVEPADWPLLPLPSEDEEAMLDLVAGTSRTSRLSCQIVLGAWPELTVRVPG